MFALARSCGAEIPGHRSEMCCALKIQFHSEPNVPRESGSLINSKIFVMQYIANMSISWNIGPLTPISAAAVQAILMQITGMWVNRLLNSS